MKTLLYSLSLQFLIFSTTLTAATMDFPKTVNESIDILTAKQTSLNPIPQLELLNAKGIAIVDITKAGFIIGGTGGYGIVLVKLNSPVLSNFQSSTVPPVSPKSAPAPASSTEALPFISNPSATPKPAPPAMPAPSPAPADTTAPDSGTPAVYQESSVWSAPIPISFSGGSFGAQIGGSNTKAIVLLNSDHAVYVFTHSGQLKWGATASGISGADSASIGKGGALSDQDVKVFKQSDGVYGGATVGGAALTLNDKFLQDAYGAGVSVNDIMNGKVQVPAYALPMIHLLQGIP